MFLSSKIKKLQAKMLVFTTVNEIALDDPLRIDIFQNVFTEFFFQK